MSKKLKRNASFVIFEPMDDKFVVITYYKDDINNTKRLEISNKVYKLLEELSYTDSNKEKVVSNAVITPHSVTVIHSVKSDILNKAKLLSFEDVVNTLDSKKCSLINISDDDVDIQEQCVFSSRCVNNLKKIIDSDNTTEVLNIIETK